MKTQRMADYYARRAPEYERVYLKPERQSNLRQLEAFLSTVLAGHDVLEVACGTGYWMQFVAKTARSIVATDVSPEVPTHSQPPKDVRSASRSFV